MSDPEALAEEFVPPDVREPMTGGVAKVASLLLLFAVVAAAARWVHALDWVPLHSLVTSARGVADAPVGDAFYELFDLGIGELQTVSLGTDDLLWQKRKRTRTH